MDGLYTVFGLGTAFGFFCSWLYDVIRRRNLPAARGASFEAFHATAEQGAPVLAPVRGIDPILDQSEPPVAPVDIPVLTPTEPTPVVSAQTSAAMPSAPAAQTNPVVAKPVEDVQAEEVVAHTDFADTVSFDKVEDSQPVPAALRVGLVINGSLEREIKEADLPGLLQELGIDADSGQAEALQSGVPVQLGEINVQLVQI